MWMTYTLFSRELDAEETVTLLMPHPHQVQGGQYSNEDLYEKRRKLPVLFAMGDEGSADNWWMRHSFAEGDIHKHIAAIVCLRGMPLDEKSLRFVGEELPILLCAQFPLDFDHMAFLGWKRSERFIEKLAGGPYRIVLKGASEDCSEAMQAALTALTGKE